MFSSPRCITLVHWVWSIFSGANLSEEGDNLTQKYGTLIGNRVQQQEHVRRFGPDHSQTSFTQTRCQSVPKTKVNIKNRFEYKLANKEDQAAIPSRGKLYGTRGTLYGTGRIWGSNNWTRMNQTTSSDFRQSDGQHAQFWCFIQFKFWKDNVCIDKKNWLKLTDKKK